MLEKNIQRQSVFGLEFVDCGDIQEVCDDILATSNNGSLNALVTPNVDILLQLDANKGSAEYELCKNARYCLPDGQPIIWSSKILGKPLESRLPGSDLFEHLWPQLSRQEMPVTLVISSQEIADALSKDNKKANFIVPPFIDVNDEYAFGQLIEDVSKAAISNSSQMIFCGLGHPKDPKIIHSLLKAWSGSPVPLCFALGASFSFYTGERKRAPKWMRKVGLEWFFRFICEPRRLFYRYFVRSPKFLGLVRRYKRIPSS